MAAWQQLAWQALRPEARQPRTWRTRFAFGLLFAVTGAWAAVAPQAALGLGERLRLGFHAMTAFGFLVAATAGLRHEIPILDDSLLSRGSMLARIFANAFKAAQELIPLIPFLLFLLALQAISATELMQVVVFISSILIASVVVSGFHFSFALLLGGALYYVSRHHNSFETSIAVLFASHLTTKAFLASAAISCAHAEKPNLAHESLAPLTGSELFAERRLRLLHRFAVPLISLAGANIVLICLLAAGAPFPLTLEQKFALVLVLFAGAVLLFIDASALIWRGLLAGLRTNNRRQSFTWLFVTIIGIPWAVAWAFSALHAGEAFTLNNGAAHFFLWVALGSTVSWFAGSTAREKLHHDFRRIISEP